MFVIVLGILLLISFMLAVLSLRKELSKPKEIESVKRELMKGKVLFINEKD